MTQAQDELFCAWLREQKNAFFKVVRAYAYTPQDQEDLFQEIATQVWRSVPNYRGDASVHTWVFRIALNVAISWSRSQTKHRNQTETLEGIDAALEATPQVHEPRLEWLYEQIAQLDEPDRSLTLLLLDGFSYRDMSAILGMSESNVGVRISRIKTRLTRQAVRENVSGI